MSSKSKLIEEVLLDLSNMLTATELNVARQSLLKVFSKYEISEAAEEYALMAIDEYNDQLLKRYLVKRSLSGIAKGSLEQYIRETKKCLTTIDKRAIDISAEDIEYYLITYRAQKQISNTSLQNMVNYINNFFLFLEDEELIQKSPCKKLPKIKPDTIPEPAFTKKEEERLLLNCSNLRDRAILEFFIATGCRVSEVCSVKIKDIDLSSHAIRIIGKGNKLRTVYADDKALLHLDRYLTSRQIDSEYLFTSLKSPYGPLTPSGIQTIMNNIAATAGILNVHPHRFRATFCTRMIDRGVPLHVVQRLMGHARIDTTMTYYRGTGNLKAEYEKYSA